MKTVVLHGHLSKFGESFKLDVRSPAEAFKAICTLIPGFKRHVEIHSEPGYHVFAGKSDRGSKEDVCLPCSESEIHFVPVIAGSGAAARVILGAVLIIVGAYFGQGWAVKLGAALVLGGIAELLAPKPPSLGTNQTPDNKPSFVFSSAVNTSGQGGPVWAVLGRFEIGSIVGSASLAAYDYNTQTSSSNVIVDALV